MALFAYNSGIIQKLAIEGSITGNSVIGGICVRNTGKIKLCINCCTVTAKDQSACGIGRCDIKDSTGTIEQCGNFSKITCPNDASGIRNWTIRYLRVF